jgi:hypothetical protein
VHHDFTIIVCIAALSSSMRCDSSIIVSSSSQEAADTGFVTIRVFNNRDKDKADELETIYSSSLRSPCFHHMRETLREYGEVSNNILAHHKCNSSGEGEGENDSGNI